MTTELLGLTPERFWANVAKGDGCWEWTAAKTPRGYGKLRVDGKNQYAHRLSWLLHTGEHPGKRLVCHKCDNPSCVRHDYHFLGDHSLNALDMMSKGRYVRTLKSHCIRGHEFTEENTYSFLLGAKLVRHCRECHRLRYHARKSANADA